MGKKGSSDPRVLPYEVAHFHPKSIKEGSGLVKCWVKDDPAVKEAERRRREAEAERKRQAAIAKAEKDAADKAAKQSKETKTQTKNPTALTRRPPTDFTGLKEKIAQSSLDKQTQLGQPNPTQPKKEQIQKTVPANPGIKNKDAVGAKNVPNLSFNHDVLKGLGTFDNRATTNAKKTETSLFDGVSNFLMPSAATAKQSTAQAHQLFHQAQTTGQKLLHQAEHKGQQLLAQGTSLAHQGMHTAQSMGKSATEFGSAAWNTAKTLNFSTQTIDQARGFYLTQSIAGKKESGLGGFVKQGFGSVGVNLVEMARQTPDTVANARDFVMNWDTDAYAQDAQKSYSAQIKQGQKLGGLPGLGHQLMGYQGMAVSSLPWVTKQIEPLLERGIDFVEDGQVKLDKMLLAKAKGMPMVEPLLKTTLKSFENDVQFRGGVMKGLGGLVGGTLNMITHPVETVKGIGALIEHVPLGAILPALSPVLASPLMFQGLPEMVRKDGGKGNNPMSLSSVLMMNPLKTERMMWESMMKGQDPRVAMRESMNPSKNLSEDGKFWSALGSAFIQPYQKAVDEGKPMEAVGRGAFEVATLLMGGAEAKAGKVATESATVAKTANKVTDVAQTANKVTEVAQAAEKVTDVAQTANKVTEGAQTAERAAGVVGATELPLAGQAPKVAGSVRRQVELDKLHYSQGDVSPKMSLPDGKKVPIETVTTDMKTNGFPKDAAPTVVEHPNGDLVSLDHRRLVAADKAGIKDVPADVVSSAQRLPQNQIDNKRFRLQTTESITDPRTGQIYPPDYVAKTYGEAALIRSANQRILKDKAGNLLYPNFPLEGSPKIPVVKGSGKAPTELAVPNIKKDLLADKGQGKNSKKQQIDNSKTKFTEEDKVNNAHPDNINPGWQDNPHRQYNCVNCAVATDATLTGFPASALPSKTKIPLPVLEEMYGKNAVRMKSQQEIQTVMSKAGSGKKGVVYVIYGDIPPQAHVFNVVNKKGKIFFIDGQKGIETEALFDNVVHMRLLQTN